MALPNMDFSGNEREEESMEQRKVIVIGPNAAGKTAICRWCQTGATCGGKYIPTTTHVDYNKAIVRLPDQAQLPGGIEVNDDDKASPPAARRRQWVMLQLWSTCGQDRLVMEIQKLFYRNAAAAVVVTDALSVFKHYDEKKGDEKAQICSDENAGDRFSKQAKQKEEARVHSKPEDAFALCVRWKQQAEKADPNLKFILLINKMDLFLPASASAISALSGGGGSSSSSPMSRNASGLDGKQSSNDFARSRSAQRTNSRTSSNGGVTPPQSSIASPIEQYQRMAAEAMPYSGEEMEAFRKEHGFAAIHYTSAKTGDGLSEAMQHAATLAMGAAIPVNASGRATRSSVSGTRPTALIHTRKEPKEKKKQSGCICSDN